jgi:hypothetical protein
MENDGLLLIENEGRRLINVMEGRRLIEGRLNGFGSEEEGLRAKDGRDETLVSPLLADSNKDLMPLEFIFDGRGFSENLGSGGEGSGSWRGSSMSMKNPTSSPDPLEWLLAVKQFRC